jgi:hypothetical protein
VSEPSAELADEAPAPRPIRPRSSRRALLAAGGAVLPAFAWVALMAARPPQYRLVVEVSLDKGWPVFLASTILLVGAVCTCLLLWRHRLLTPATALTAVVPTIAALTSCWFLAGFSAVLLPGFFLALAIPAAVLFLRRRPVAALPERFRRWSGAAAVALALLVFLSFAFWSAASPIGMPRNVGGLAIVSVFLAFAGVLLTWAVLNPKLGAIAAAWWAFAALFFAPNNHEVPSRPAAMGSQGVEQALREWLPRRRDLDAYRRARLPYPVIFISSEGGGIYAAAHAHAVLSTLAARCPTFAQHVLVTVGVSGGAAGNALFHAAADPVQKTAAPCSPGETRLDQAALTADHLSPILARFLLLETIDSALPGRWIGEDRGAMLTASFRSSMGDHPALGDPVARSFDPGSARPAVAAVATDIGTGGRLVLSPISAAGSTAKWWPGEVPPAGRDTDVLEAAGISARFPWVTPTARLHLSDQASLVLADGGYFENSGAETVLDLIRELRSVEAREIADEVAGNEPAEPVCRLHVARNFDAPAEWRGCAIHIFPIHLAITTTMINPEEEPQPANVSQSFLLDPLSTLISTRSSRGRLALQRAQEEHCGTLGALCVEQPGATAGFFQSYVSPVELGLPLGWYIRPQEAAAIAEAAVPREIFSYRQGREALGSDLGLLILHLDPALWAPGADPGITDYRGLP